MSEEQMNDSTFGRLFIIMVISMTALAVIFMILASFAASDVNTKLDERSDLENSQSIADRIAPVGDFAVDSASTPSTEATTPTVSVLLGEEAYTSCSACHLQGIAGAPQLGDVEAWATRLTQGIDLLYDHAINGYSGASGYMPAKGGNTSLSDDSVKAAVDYMVSKSK